jgi:hypothetical protein
MKLTNKSQKLINLVSHNNCINNSKLTNKCENVIKTIYNHITDGYNVLYKEKITSGFTFFYNLQLFKMNSLKQIPRPTTFPTNAFPEVINSHINNNIVSCIRYNISFLNKQIAINFLSEDRDISKYIDTYNEYVDNMLVWIYLLNIYSTENCKGNNNITVFIYLTTLEKYLPNDNKLILDEENVNTAFTFSCPTNKSEIVIFRKEEWFKVFIHETFHNFGLDFSEMNINVCKKILSSIFPINSELNVYEAYSEFWARIMNTIFCSYTICKTNKKYDFQSFINMFNQFINYEITYSLLQANKVLAYMNLFYQYLYENDSYSHSLRQQFYKENTNVFAYYIITGILIYNYQDFILWCHVNNTNLLQFKKTISHQKEFCKFIEKRYKKRLFLNDINCIHLFLIRLINKSNKTNSEKYLINNLRMTLCEFE